MNSIEIPSNIIDKVKGYLTLNTEECVNYSILNKDGYGLIQYRIVLNDKPKHIHLLTHRLVYILYTNETITINDIICHSCDNRACCNPKHLFKGTHNDNVQDKVSKDRQAKGINNGRYTTGYYSKYNPVEKPKAKFEDLKSRSLNIEQAKELKELIKNRGTKSLKDLAIELNLSVYLIRDISSGRTYKNI